ncbi:hypothetical protein OGAPHI_005038 [Ogataea philodendri]|uniref:Uncharacterized protein n=1 Tax=Ogataea philodendri TaxID=1378263 RepID=A0A9P8P1V7_9ASCO|nr:uncharacterized protein OGAPHI_005038 [Ogataea philodendri]KAH3663637.1 hypothetical protein OGAPHI_005038 [Ogataea philodendri]
MLELKEPEEVVVENAKIGTENKPFLSADPAAMSSKAEAPSIQVMPPNTERRNTVSKLDNLGVDISSVLFFDQVVRRLELLAFGDSMLDTFSAWLSSAFNLEQVLIFEFDNSIRRKGRRGMCGGQRRHVTGSGGVFRVGFVHSEIVVASWVECGREHIVW